MIPLKEIGREGQPVPVAEFTGGEAPFGPSLCLADGIVSAPGETAVIVANPQDKTIYYYMEGAAAPMGNFGNYGRAPRAVMAIDRSLRETEPGVYETTAEMPPAGAYDTVFFLDSPRLAYCFESEVRPNPAASEAARGAVRLECVGGQTLRALTPAHLAFRLRSAEKPDSVSVSAPNDLTITSMLAPGRWHLSREAAPAGDGTLVFSFTPPESGVYYFYASSASLGPALSRAPCVVLEAGAPAFSSVP
jgi:hypothetical protein